jgi:hypothetical protein
MWLLGSAGRVSQGDWIGRVGKVGRVGRFDQFNQFGQLGSIYKKRRREEEKKEGDISIRAREGSAMSPDPDLSRLPQIMAAETACAQAWIGARDVPATPLVLAHGAP